MLFVTLFSLPYFYFPYLSHLQCIPVVDDKIVFFLSGPRKPDPSHTLSIWPTCDSRSNVFCFHLLQRLLPKLILIISVTRGMEDVVIRYFIPPTLVEGTLEAESAQANVRVYGKRYLKTFRNAPIFN